MEPISAILLAMRVLAAPVLLIAALLALVFGPVLLMRFAADRAAAARRKLSAPRGGVLIVKEESGRLSPTAVPANRPRPGGRKSDSVFAALKALSAFSGTAGLLATTQFPGALLPIAALLAGFPGLLLVLAFEQRYRAKVEAPGDAHEDAQR